MENESAMTEAFTSTKRSSETTAVEATSSLLVYNRRKALMSHFKIKFLLQWWDPASGGVLTRLYSSTFSRWVSWQMHKLRNFCHSFRTESL